MSFSSPLLTDLVRRVPPPARPTGGQGDWAAVEASLGTRLPSDFKALVATYGRGEFCDVIGLCTPFGEDNPVRLTAELLEDYGSSREMFPERYPYPLFPEPGGLIAWGLTDVGHHLCWLTVGEPDSWPVVVWSRDDDHEEYDCCATDFIEGWVSGRIVSEVMPDDEGLAPWFDAAREEVHVYVPLSEGSLPYPERLRILREALAPTVDRGSFHSAYDDSRQDHFATVETGWRLTYETAYGHQIRVAFPPGDSERARRAVLGAVVAMGCEVLGANTVHGAAAWGPTS
ncbi:SMI1/KNR4 family protein [Streptomyces syringium]|uniref:SMI1/KNR4 family protein n=1 Tax=Streptomyces syringium TaxID=76729 RepID=UPI0036952840